MPPIGLKTMPEFAVPEIARTSGDAPREAARQSVFWHDVYDCHFDEIHRLVFRSGIPAAETEDVTQTVFLRAFQRADRLRDPSAPDYNVRAWLYGIALRVVSEHRRWRRIRRLKAWLLENTMGAVNRAPVTPEDASAAHETQKRVGAVLTKMSSKLRDVLVLRDIDEQSLEETALALGIPENTVRSRLRLARQKFGELWAEGNGVTDGEKKEPTWT